VSACSDGRTKCSDEPSAAKKKEKRKKEKKEKKSGVYVRAYERTEGSAEHCCDGVVSSPAPVGPSAERC